MAVRPPTGPPPEALIVGYTGVIGREPSLRWWAQLADLAGWGDDQVGAFRSAFRRHRPAYDSGAATDHQFWSQLIRRPWRPRGELLATLRWADASMWLSTDADALVALRSARAAGLRVVLLTNAAHPVAEALDAAAWRTQVVSRAVYSARLGIAKPEPGVYRAAWAAAGWPDPSRVLVVEGSRAHCSAAAAVGLPTLHYTSPSQLAKHASGRGSLPAAATEALRRRSP